MTSGGARPATASPVSGFERRYETSTRALAAPRDAGDAVWPTWRSAFRTRLLDRLGIEPRFGTVPDYHVIEETRHATHRRFLLDIESPAGDSMRVWLLFPLGGVQPRPAVVAVHGHGSGVNEIVGLGPDGTPRTGPAGYQHDLALSLVDRGFTVAAPELLGFGSRRLPDDALAGVEANSCRSLAAWALMLGTTVVGQRVRDLCLVVDLLRLRDEVDESSIGIFGISGGATASLFATAIDDRLGAAVLSGYVNSFRASILAIDHCVCNLVPGLLTDAEMEDIALAISPRPLLLEAGRDDPIFPIATAEAAADRIRRGYAEQGHADRFEVDVFAGGHEVSGRKAFTFLARWLGVDADAGRVAEGA